MRRDLLSVRPSFVVAIVSVLALAFGGGWSAIRAQEKGVTAKPKVTIEGAWKQVGQIDPATGKVARFPDGIEQTKLITGGRFAWTVTSEGKVLATSGGSYELKDGVYTEKVTFVGSDNHQHLLGKSFAYPLMLEDGKWHLKATFKLEDREMTIDEFWERCPVETKGVGPRVSSSKKRGQEPFMF